MANISLLFPTIGMEETVMEFKREFFDCGEKTINGSYQLDMEKYSYPEWLKKITDCLRQETADPKYGTSQIFFAVDEAGKIVGVINFRHELTEFYKDAGHIGYSVRPSERGKGYASAMLRQLLPMARAQGFSHVLLVCKVGNTASQKVILNNGGKATRAFTKDGMNCEEYRIDLI